MCCLFLSWTASCCQFRHWLLKVGKFCFKTATVIFASGEIDRASAQGREAFSSAG
ncbi:hypothetical protein PF008_g21155 [Phytophthora fragariae]|uniref:Uncharacterized protein n=1 Tax=Phytophthora fragariae TaxID=53985 RepID=A0A6G0QXE6_9STRA|nr:hypothetical protein PF008_g21155 [Phytophthora fragariae]